MYTYKNPLLKALKRAAQTPAGVPTPQIQAVLGRFAGLNDAQMKVIEAIDWVNVMWPAVGTHQANLRAIEQHLNGLQAALNVVKTAGAADLTANWADELLWDTTANRATHAAPFDTMDVLGMHLAVVEDPTIREFLQYFMLAQGLFATSAQLDDLNERLRIIGKNPNINQHIQTVNQVLVDWGTAYGFNTLLPPNFTDVATWSATAHGAAFNGTQAGQHFGVYVHASAALHGIADPVVRRDLLEHSFNVLWYPTPDQVAAFNVAHEKLKKNQASAQAHAAAVDTLIQTFANGAWAVAANTPLSGISGIPANFYQAAVAVNPRFGFAEDLRRLAPLHAIIDLEVRKALLEWAEANDSWEPTEAYVTTVNAKLKKLKQVSDATAGAGLPQHIIAHARAVDAIITANAGANGPAPPAAIFAAGGRAEARASELRRSAPLNGLVPGFREYLQEHARLDNAFEPTEEQVVKLNREYEFIRKNLPAAQRVQRYQAALIKILQPTLGGPVPGAPAANFFAAGLGASGLGASGFTSLVAQHDSLKDLLLTTRPVLRGLLLEFANENPLFIPNATDISDLNLALDALGPSPSAAQLDTALRNWATANVGGLNRNARTAPLATALHSAGADRPLFAAGGVYADLFSPDVLADHRRVRSCRGIKHGGIRRLLEEIWPTDKVPEAVVNHLNSIDWRKPPLVQGCNDTVLLGEIQNVLNDLAVPANAVLFPGGATPPALTNWANNQLLDLTLRVAPGMKSALAFNIPSLAANNADLFHGEAFLAKYMPQEIRDWLQENPAIWTDVATRLGARATEAEAQQMIDGWLTRLAQSQDAATPVTGLRIAACFTTVINPPNAQLFNAVPNNVELTDAKTRSLRAAARRKLWIQPALDVLPPAYTKIRDFYNDPSKHGNILTTLGADSTANNEHAPAFWQNQLAILTNLNLTGAGKAETDAAAQLIGVQAGDTTTLSALYGQRQRLAVAAALRARGNVEAAKQFEAVPDPVTPANTAISRETAAAFERALAGKTPAQAVSDVIGPLTNRMSTRQQHAELFKTLLATMKDPANPANAASPTTIAAKVNECARAVNDKDALSRLRVVAELDRRCENRLLFKFLQAAISELTVPQAEEILINLSQIQANFKQIAVQNSAGDFADLSYLRDRFGNSNIGTNLAGKLGTITPPATFTVEPVARQVWPLPNTPSQIFAAIKTEQERVNSFDRIQSDVVKRLLRQATIVGAFDLGGNTQVDDLNNWLTINPPPTVTYDQFIAFAEYPAAGGLGFPATAGNQTQGAITVQNGLGIANARLIISEAAFNEIIRERSLWSNIGVDRAKNARAIIESKVESISSRTEHIGSSAYLQTLKEKLASLQARTGRGVATLHLRERDKWEIRELHSLAAQIKEIQERLTLRREELNLELTQIRTLEVASYNPHDSKKATLLLMKQKLEQEGVSPSESEARAAKNFELAQKAWIANEKIEKNKKELAELEASAAELAVLIEKQKIKVEELNRSKRGDNLDALGQPVDSTQIIFASRFQIQNGADATQSFINLGLIPPTGMMVAGAVPAPAYEHDDAKGYSGPGPAPAVGARGVGYEPQRIHPGLHPNQVYSGTAGDPAAPSMGWIKSPDMSLAAYVKKDDAYTDAELEKLASQIVLDHGDSPTPIHLVGTDKKYVEKMYYLVLAKLAEEYKRHNPKLSVQEAVEEAQKMVSTAGTPFSPPAKIKFSFFTNDDGRLVITTGASLVSLGAGIAGVTAGATLTGGIAALALGLSALCYVAWNKLRPNSGAKFKDAFNTIPITEKKPASAATLANVNVGMQEEDIARQRLKMP